MAASAPQTHFLASLSVSAHVKPERHVTKTPVCECPRASSFAYLLVDDDKKLVDSSSFLALPHPKRFQYRPFISDVTQILDRVHQGDSKAAEELLPLVYDELRKLAAHRMAGEAAGHTLQPTALVHEAWLRLVRTPNQAWQNRAHFFRTAAECMRRILIDNARRKLQLRHGGGSERVPLDDIELAGEHDPRQLLHVHEALDRLAAEDATKAEIVKLRFFVGLENREIAELLDISERTVERAWRFAKAWLLAEFNGGHKAP